ncbi:MAG: sigma-54 dependent transcriptional regulator [Candidatus Marinimicrobia bacterium]|jgi:DNA-binding NtrC family response regulator|nr:sigma-54 dependent transcriptional regulator [Candidatus Neomarinimicrobiota bacterium]MCK9483246.1 sigma-54 dependent transcriptional regulator [Candidatus Neomarinimicrobiota bacterium]MCK9559863.1 sigma-54 dependent transcriptional regulator [Candidatus Neomarinimicrobiota bacterium]MDD5060949.1 sigma-54 dependent transcriptional regulator [Candidatus Neomarinimicrobiota bacterium]MDD5229830.1 sigma-54 dependent transcriptional regulator [Candidatus Neomarinimicrobiota bacterium]
MVKSTKNKLNATNRRILIADRDPELCQTLNAFLNAKGFTCQTAVDGNLVLQLLNEKEFDLLIIDLHLPKHTGIEILEKIPAISPQTLTILMTSSATAETAVEALRKGAIDYLVKPFDYKILLDHLEKAVRLKSLSVANRFMRREISAKYHTDQIIGDSPAMKNVYNLIGKVANSSSNILITGKSGTGKELVARAIHQNSPRENAPFIAINCGAIPETLFESELFGLKKGSFTGATMDKDGVFRAANGGTLFLDEVGEIPIHIQVKLLRAIESKEIKPIGSTNSLIMDVRILSATQKDLLKEIEEGNFREDLYYRLNIIEIHLPSLTERKEDIPLLVDHFIRIYNDELRRKVIGADRDTLKILMSYKWKGEVRELENVIERAVLLCEGDYITPRDLPPNLSSNLSDLIDTSDDLKGSVRNFERQHILTILRRVDFDKNKCAELLGIGLSSLYRKIDELGIEL